MGVGSRAPRRRQLHNSSSRIGSNTRHAFPLLSKPFLAPSHLVQELNALGEEEVGVDEDHLDLVEEAGLGDGVEDDAVTGDQGRGEQRVLLVLPRRVRLIDWPKEHVEEWGGGGGVLV